MHIEISGTEQRLENRIALEYKNAVEAINDDLDLARIVESSYPELLDNEIVLNYVIQDVFNSSKTQSSPRGYIQIQCAAFAGIFLAVLRQCGASEVEVDICSESIDGDPIDIGINNHVKVIYNNKVYQKWPKKLATITNA